MTNHNYMDYLYVPDYSPDAPLVMTPEVARALIVAHDEGRGMSDELLARAREYVQMETAATVIAQAYNDEIEIPDGCMTKIDSDGTVTHVEIPDTFEGFVATLAASIGMTMDDVDAMRAENRKLRSSAERIEHWQKDARSFNNFDLGDKIITFKGRNGAFDVSWWKNDDGTYCRQDRDNTYRYAAKDGQ